MGLLVVLGATVRSWARGHALLRTGAWLLAGTLVLGAAVFAYPPPQTRIAGGEDRSPSGPVQTRQGPVTGVYNDERTVEVFAGIPYAQAPVGDLRWRAPEPPKPREGVFTADRFSAVPVQGTSTFFTRALSQIVEVPLEGTFLNPYPVSEDSLSLNIWRSTTPASADLPVLVYIPGGGFATGSGALPLYDGEALASRGEVITVTINYRLGVLGFLSHPELSAESAHDASGNYGILDQIAALAWVRDNIAAFGGDPDQVTIAGESAGGESVCILGATPLAEDLVDGIIAGSGACMGTTGNTERGDQTDTREAAEDAGRRLSEQLGGATIEEMRDMPVERVLDAAGTLDAHWQPSVDGHVLTRSPAETYASGEQLDVPTLVGSNADEASLALASPPDTDVDEYRSSARETYGADADRFLDLYPGETAQQVLESRLRAETDKIMTRAMRRWAQLQTQTGESDAYLYFFSHVPPEKGLEKYGAYHGAEVAYAYDNLGADSAADYTEADYRLRDQMSAYWVSFVRTGDPNAPGLPAWPTVEQAPDHVMEFAGRSGMAPRPRSDAVDFWMDYDGPIP
ncbi:carboxylesterase family protein [Micromonospora sp. WMMD961]|uniref:carboxylesterase/lipase family protein n=1 Tax=Micromonospora sp. WMMD961 TaxID=3016100 RepID=UPI0024167D35|nr:carboxylesterase family protein [Micromonospora sp. WMMD961]MDG4782398.1 carboxylesterase family protein [Micromonospora sp. WMMD961]